MRLVCLNEKVSQRGVVRLHHLTDLHDGAPDFDEEAFLARRALIEQDPFARWTMGGDGGELIRHNDPRYEPSSVHPHYRQATDMRLATRERLVKLFAPIKDKCWAWADGNHERAVDKYYGGHFGVEVCCDLGLESRYVDYRGFVRVILESTTRGNGLGVLIDIQHGWQAGRLKGAPLVQAEREMGMSEADVVLRGHNHAPGGWSFRTFGVTTNSRGPGRIVTRPRTLINGGTWRRGWRDVPPVDPEQMSATEKALWHETKGYRPEPVGGPVLMLTFDQGHGRTKTSDGRPALIEHTIISDTINATTLGLE